MRLGMGVICKTGRAQIAVIPAKAGIHPGRLQDLVKEWIPAFAGMTCVSKRIARRLHFSRARLN